MVITALIVVVAMTASFWVGTKYPDPIARQQGAWRAEGRATAEAVARCVNAWDVCPYDGRTPSERAFWFAGFKDVRPTKGESEPGNLETT